MGGMMEVELGRIAAQCAVLILIERRSPPKRSRRFRNTCKWHSRSPALLAVAL